MIYLVNLLVLCFLVRNLFVRLDFMDLRKNLIIQIDDILAGGIMGGLSVILIVRRVYWFITVWYIERKEII